MMGSWGQIIAMVVVISFPTAYGVWYILTTAGSNRKCLLHHKKPEFLPFIIIFFFLNDKAHSNLSFHAFLL